MKQYYSHKLYLALFLFLICFAILLPMRLQYFSLVAGSIILFIFDASAFKELGKIKFWSFVVFLILVVPFILGEKKYILWGFGYSGAYLILGIQMLMRGLSIYMAVMLLNRNVSIDYIAGIFVSLGFKDLSIALPIALNILPILRRNLLDSLAVFQLRGGFKKHRIKNLEKLFLAVILTTVRTGEEIYQILEMKNRMVIAERRSNNVAAD